MEEYIIEDLHKGRVQCSCFDAFTQTPATFLHPHLSSSQQTEQPLSVVCIHPQYIRDGCVQCLVGSLFHVLHKCSLICSAFSREELLLCLIHFHLCFYAIIEEIAWTHLYCRCHHLRWCTCWSLKKQALMLQDTAQLQNVKKVDVVWDEYVHGSLSDFAHAHLKLGMPDSHVQRIHQGLHDMSGRKVNSHSPCWWITEEREVVRSHLSIPGGYQSISTIVWLYQKFLHGNFTANKTCTALMEVLLVSHGNPAALWWCLGQRWPV